MKHIIFLALPLGISLLPRAAVAQDAPHIAHPFTLAQVWEKAIQNNKRIQIQQLQTDASDEEVKDAVTDRLPEITADGEYARVSKMPIYEKGLFNAPAQYPVLHSTYGVGIDAYLNLYNGNKTNLNIAQKKTTAKMRRLQTAQTTADVKLAVAVAFLQLKRSLVFKDLLLSDIISQQKQLAKIEQLRKNGVVLKSDVLRAQLQLSRQQLQLNTIDNDIAIANQRLDVAIGEPDDFSITPQGDVQADSVKVDTYDNCLVQANAHAYKEKISEEETHLHELQLKQAKGAYMPKVGLFANYTFSYPQILFYPYSPYLYSFGMAGVKASFSISGLYTNKHKVKATEIELKQQEIEHQDTRDAISLSVNSYYLRLQEAMHRVNVAQTNVQQAIENSRIVNNTYFNQTSLITDLLDANNALLQTRFELASAKIEVQIQYYQLQNAIGNL
ncbi:TolC family protein [Mucilaginibacter sp. JRF]|uniref:TolC family protein n=1 Tax=Mucilaginibacter sp. JRF TaxID=2780088 RepID=UPI00187E949B|nr:TolC family protein [Mucilaginibacter sp. JRF]MBE9583759.1 TolC family protein [Mucilaginibacter sp. JRF]